MITVAKYRAPVGNELQIDMPQGAELLSVQVQWIPEGGTKYEPRLWAIVDENRPKIPRRFVWIPDGEKLDLAAPKTLTDNVRYVGSVQIGAHGWHLFACPEAA